MVLPKTFDLRWRKESQIALTQFAPGSSLVSRLLKLVIDIAYAAMAVITLITLIAFVAAIFIPLSKLSITIENGGEAQQMPLTRGLLLFALGVICVYFASFVAILRKLRQIYATLLIGDPFQPQNSARLTLIGTVLAAVTYGGWFAQTLAAKHIAPGALEAPGISQLLTPSFAVIVIFVLSEVFREGSRLRQEAELTI